MQLLMMVSESRYLQIFRPDMMRVSFAVASGSRLDVSYAVPGCPLILSHVCALLARVMGGVIQTRNAAPQRLSCPWFLVIVLQAEFVPHVHG